jgi:hypothetical protein
VDHGLPQLVLTVNILNKVRLVHDVHQMNKLRSSPEHLAHTNTKLPFLAKEQVIQLSNIEMSPFWICAVEPGIGDKGKSGAVFPFVIQLRGNGQGPADILLTRERRLINEKPSLSGYVA